MTRQWIGLLMILGLMIGSGRGTAWCTNVLLFFLCLECFVTVGSLFLLESAEPSTETKKKMGENFAISETFPFNIFPFVVLIFLVIQGWWVMVSVHFIRITAYVIYLNWAKSVLAKDATNG